MPPIPGTVRIAGTMAPTDSTDVYPVTDVIYQKGGYLSVANAAARLAITTERRSLGMLVREEDTGAVYMLIGGIADINWTAQAVMSSGATVMTSGNVVTIVSGMGLPSGVYANSGNYWVVTSGQSYVTSGLSTKENSGVCWVTASGQAYTNSGIYAAGLLKQNSGVYLNSGDVIANNSGTTLLSMSGVTAVSGVHTCTSGGTLNTVVTRALVPSAGITYALSGECIRIDAAQLQAFSYTFYDDATEVVSGNYIQPICLIPSTMNDWYFIEAAGKVYDPAGNGDTCVNIKSRNGNTDTAMMVSAITIGAGSYYAKGNIKTAGGWNQVSTGDAFYAVPDSIGTGNAPKGLIVTLEFSRDQPGTMP